MPRNLFVTGGVGLQRWRVQRITPKLHSILSPKENAVRCRQIVPGCCREVAGFRQTDPELLFARILRQRITVQLFERGNTMEMVFRALRALPALCAIMCMAYSPAWCADPIGEAGAVDGTVRIMPKGKTEFKDLTEGDSFGLDDNVTTEEKSKVWLRFTDDSHHSLGEESGVLFNDSGDDKGATFYHGHITEGEIRIIKKLPKTEPPSSYVITTPSAIVDVQPTDDAADFVVRVNNNLQTSVSVIWGKVKVKNILEDIQEQRTLRSCQRVLVNAGEKPSKVFGISSESLKKAIERTTIPETLPDKVPQCEKAKRDCRCPWGTALDTDGTCKPCAFFAGAVYDPETCSCVCPCPDGTVPHPYTGECEERCPTSFPLEVDVWGGPHADVLPHEGCPACVCCPEYEDCYLGTPWDYGCPDARCGKCGAIPLVFPPLVLPPDPFGWYPCAKCCVCDAAFHFAGDPCGLNAAGFFSGWPCGVGGKCISRSDCLAQGGYFVRTDDRFAFRPCWVCQRDLPFAFFAVKGKAAGEPCPPCTKLTFRNGKAECVADPNKKDCYVEGRCGECKDGKCVEMPECPEGQVRNHKCECETLEAPPKECGSDRDCVEKTKGVKPCCRQSMCAELQRCPDGKRKCSCEREPVPPPPGPQPPPEEEDCEPCGRRVQGKCVYPYCPPGEKLNPKTCRCEPVDEPECTDDGECDRCERCVRGECRGPVCKRGQRLNLSTCRCEDVFRPECRAARDCDRCERCIDGRCISRTCPKGTRLDPKTCECIGGPEPECRSSADCGRCERCVNGNCVRKTCPSGYTLNLKTCSCVQETVPECRRNSDCPRCEQCVRGTCIRRNCPGGQQLNLRTCECEGGPSLGVPECRSNRDCGPNEACRKGKCVRIRRPAPELPEAGPIQIDPRIPERPVIPRKPPIQVRPEKTPGIQEIPQNRGLQQQLEEKPEIRNIPRSINRQMQVPREFSPNMDRVK